MIQKTSRPEFIFFQDFIYLFLERGKGERKRGKHQCVVASHVASTEDLAHNPGMCPDREWNWQPFGSQPALNPLSHTSQGSFYLMFIKPNVIYVFLKHV